jgi:hypothetical protein
MNQQQKDTGKINATSISQDTIEELLRNIIIEVKPNYEGHLMIAKYKPQTSPSTSNDVPEACIIEEKQHRGFFRRKLNLPSRTKYHRIFSIEDNIVENYQNNPRAIKTYVEKNNTKNAKNIDISKIALKYLRPISEEYNAKVIMQYFRK